MTANDINPHAQRANQVQAVLVATVDCLRKHRAVREAAGNG